VREWISDLLLGIVAVVAGVAPARLWPRLEPPLPLHGAAVISGIATLTAGFAIGVPGFFAFAEHLGRANNDWMLQQLAAAPKASDNAVGLVPYGVSLLTLFIFIFLTPRGLFSMYLVTSGTLRAISAWVDDPRGDFILTGIDWAVSTLFARNRRDRQRIGRERREGRDAPDVLRTGEWAGLSGVDYVVLAARRKAEWDPGAIVITSAEWYRLGVPFDLETPAGLRTAYPLTKLDTVEVVRRGIQYELPRLTGASRGVRLPPSRA